MFSYPDGSLPVPEPCWPGWEIDFGDPNIIQWRGVVPLVATAGQPLLLSVLSR